MSKIPEQPNWKTVATTRFRDVRFQSWQNLWFWPGQVPWHISEPDWNNQRIVDQPPFSWVFEAIPFPELFFVEAATPTAPFGEDPSWVSIEHVPSLTMRDSQLKWLYGVLKLRDALITYTPTAKQKENFKNILLPLVNVETSQPPKWEEIRQWALRTLFFLTNFPYLVTYADDLWHLRKDADHQFNSHTGYTAKNPTMLSHRPSSYALMAWRRLHGDWKNTGRSTDSMVYQPSQFRPEESLFTDENNEMPSFPLIAREEPHAAGQRPFTPIDALKKRLKYYDIHYRGLLKGEEKLPR